MARVKWSKNLREVQKVAGDIAKKDSSDADKSVIKPYLTKHKIVPADLKKNMDLVVQKDSERLLLEGEANTKFNERDTLMQPIEKTMHGWVQRLKSYNSDNIKEVQSWGVEVLEGGKIVYPSDFLNTAALVKTIIVKHNGYKAPDVSPLEVYNVANNVNVANISANLALAETADEEAREKTNASTTATAERNKLYKPTLKSLKGIGTEITKIHPDDPNKWKTWGLEVVLDPVKKQAERTVKVPLGKNVKKTNIVTGTIFKNVGNVDLMLEKGGKLKSTPQLVKQSEEVLLGKGFGKIVVNSTDLLKEGAFTVTVHL